MRKHKHFELKPLLAAVALGLMVSLGLVAPVQAAASSGQTANGFVISPVRTLITIKKGQSQTVELSVQNPTSVSTIIKPIVNDFIASNDESGSPRLILNNGSPLPANNFKSLVGALPNISLGAGQEQYINVTISVPANANSGGYYGAIRFVPANTSQKGNVGLTASVGSLFLVTVPGNLTEKLNLVQLSAANPKTGDASSFFTSGKVAALVRLQNVGNIHVEPFGTVTVKNTFGKTVDTYQFNSAQGSVLPSSTRQFVDTLANKHWFGHYTIQATIAYQQGTGNFITANASFWYLPAWFLIILLAVIVIIALTIYYLVHRWRRYHASARPKKKKR